MKAILLDGSDANDNTGTRVRAALTTELVAQGWDVEHVALCEKKIGPCTGDFFCFVRTPGVCRVNDDNRAIAAAIAVSDLTVYLTPVAFGGYAPTLKRMVDHQMQNISPFFARVAGETHHAKRYRKNPDFLVVGWMDAPDAQVEAIFRHLVQRNALNWHSRTWVGDVVLAGQSDGELQASARQWVDDIQNRRSSPQVELPDSQATRQGSVEIRRALLLVGSPKTHKSTSNSLGEYLFEQLSAQSGETAQSIETETIYLHAVLRSPAKMQALLDAVDAADLIALAFPLYVDSLPAPVIEALERIAANRGQGISHSRGSSRPRFVAIANCGFPEAYQCATGLAICETFARQAGFEWAGALALGGGQMLNGVPLVEGGGMTLYWRRSLELAAGGLVEEGAVSEEAREGLATPIIPRWLYWVTGWLRWVRDSKSHGALRSVYRKPYLARAR